MSTTPDGIGATSSGNSEEPAGSHSARQLRRPIRGRMLAGVAAGFADYLGTDVTVVRVAIVVITILGFTGLPFLGFVPLYLAGIPLYLASWVLIPEQGSDNSIASRLLRSAQHRPR